MSLFDIDFRRVGKDAGNKTEMRIRYFDMNEMAITRGRGYWFIPDRCLRNLEVESSHRHVGTSFIYCELHRVKTMKKRQRMTNFLRNV